MGEKQEERKYALTMASYACERQHVWRTQAAWTNLQITEELSTEEFLVLFKIGQEVFKKF